jgi:uncharacterized protein YdeI (YjbR/CyaY-like superfamily)
VSGKPTFFNSAAEFRRWLHANHDKVPELWVGLCKVASGRRGLTYLEAVDEALCYGWIDGHKKSHDAQTFKQRFTPRRARSIWSAINIRKVESLKKTGRMAAPGLRAYALKDPARTYVYSFENHDRTLDPDYENRFRAKKKAWAFFEAQPPGYRRLCIHWVMKAKKPETRERRLAQLMANSAALRRVGAVVGPAKDKLGG